MSVEIVTPGDNVGAIIGDLNARRGHSLKQSVRGDESVIESHVPFASLFGYISQLKSISQGRATHSMIPATTPKCRATPVATTISRQRSACVCEHGRTAQSSDDA